MRYVKTNRIALVSTEYPSEIIFEKRNREFYEKFPAPKTFKVPTNSKKRPYIGSDAFQILTIWYCRGTTLIFPASEITTKKPREQWRYRFVDSLPLFYIQKKATKTQDAYDLTAELIAACTSASQIPFETLETAYKTIMKECLAHNITAYSPNAKTWLEAKAERETQEDLINLFDFDLQDDAHTLANTYNDEILNHYAKVFDIQMPEWYFKITNIKTKHGFAICPRVDLVGATFYNNKPDQPGYAGTLDLTGKEAQKVPSTLGKDAYARPVHNYVAEKARLTELIKSYMALPIDIRVDYIAPDYTYCACCEHYCARLDGCSCGKIKPITEDDLYLIKLGCTEI